MTTTRRRERFIGHHETDIDATRRAVSDANKDAARQNAGDKTVTVSIERDFTLTDDNGVKFEYKTGLDDMPLSHANHWYSKNAGGVKLYSPRRGGKSAKTEDNEGPVTPPQPDPEILAQLDRTHVEVAPGGSIVDPTKV